MSASPLTSRALFQRRRRPSCCDASADDEEDEDLEPELAGLREDSDMSALRRSHRPHPNTPTAVTPTPGGGDDEDHGGEHRDAFRSLPPQPLGRPMPLMAQHLQLRPQPQSLQLEMEQQQSSGEHYKAKGQLPTATSTSSAGGISRSISDSTLRRAALHLNLSQSVLPSFTSLQQFKVYPGYLVTQVKLMVYN